MGGNYAWEPATPAPAPVEGTPCAGCGAITPEADLWGPSATDRLVRPHLLAGEFYCLVCLGTAEAPAEEADSGMIYCRREAVEQG